MASEPRRLQTRLETFFHDHSISRDVAEPYSFSAGDGPEWAKCYVLGLDGRVCTSDYHEVVQTFYDSDKSMLSERGAFLDMSPSIGSILAGYDLLVITDSTPDALCLNSHGVPAIAAIGKLEGANVGHLDWAEISLKNKRPIAFIGKGLLLEKCKAYCKTKGALVFDVLIADRGNGHRVSVTNFFYEHVQEAKIEVKLCIEKALEAAIIQDREQETAAEHLLAEMNAEICVIEKGDAGGTLMQLQPNGTWRPKKHEELRTIYGHIRPPEGKDAIAWWLRHERRRSYQDVVFEPGSQREGVLNLWSGWGVEARKGDCSLFWAHVWHVICSGSVEHATYVRKWLAYLVQRPAELPQTALVLVGAPGTGKGQFMHYVGRIVGSAHYALPPSAEGLTGRFNSYLASALLAFADEVTWGGNKQSSGILKTMITEPFRTIEYKFQNPYKVANYTRFVFASNEMFPVEVGAQDRRFLVLNVASSHQNDTTYFEKLIAERESGGAEALMWDLMHEDLTGFLPYLRPTTAATWDLMEQSLDSDMGFWYVVLNSGEFVLGIDPHHGGMRKTLWHSRSSMAKSEIYEAYEYHYHRSRSRQRLVPVALFFRKAAHVGILPDRDVRNRTFKGNIRKKSLPRLTDARKAFELAVGMGPEIWAEGVPDDYTPLRDEEEIPDMGF